MKRGLKLVHALQMPSTSVPALWRTVSFLQRTREKPDVVVHASNPNTWNTEAEGSIALAIHRDPASIPTLPSKKEKDQRVKYL
jgi:hypothetical protein